LLVVGQLIEIDILAPSKLAHDRTQSPEYANAQFALKMNAMATSSPMAKNIFGLETITPNPQFLREKKIQEP
jgi:hypothetical protein